MTLNKKKTSFCVKACLASSTALYLINKILYIKSISKERLFSSNSSYYNWKFGKIFYTVRGTGSPVLLVHDINCESSEYEWKNIVNSLAQTHTVYTIDLLGCGRSDKPMITYTNYLYVQLISDFVKNVIKHKVHIIATGLSSSACIMACYIEPQQIEKLTLVNPISLSKLSKSFKASNKLLKRMIEIPILGTFIYNIKYSNTMIRRRFRHKYFSNSDKVTRRMIQAYSEAAHLGGYASKYLMSSTCAKFVNININRAVQSLNNDIQIIMGSDVPKCDSILNSYLALNPSIETEIIPDTKYLPQMENPEEFLKLCEIYI